MTIRIVRDLSADAYHATPALSASGAWQLADECPAIYWHNSPLNPDAAPSGNGKPMDIGTALHLAVLEPGRFADRTIVVDAADWRTKAAQVARDAAYESGVTPLLPKDQELVERLRAALLANEFAADLLDGAETEISYFWTSEEGVPCKARADLVTRDGRAIGDLKASASASPVFFQRQAINAGHFLRSPWYADGWQLADGRRADYWYIIVAREAPHLVTLARLDERAIEWGRMMIRRSLELFQRCRERGEWPAYCDGPATLSLPGWAEYQLADQEQAGRFDRTKIRAHPNAEEVRRGFDFLAPRENVHA